MKLSVTRDLWRTFTRRIPCDTRETNRP